jgi:hypothetical protein
MCHASAPTVHMRDALQKSKMILEERRRFGAARVRQ